MGRGRRSQIQCLEDHGNDMRLQSVMCLLLQKWLTIIIAKVIDSWSCVCKISALKRLFVLLNSLQLQWFLSATLSWKCFDFALVALALALSHLQPWLLLHKAAFTTLAISISLAIMTDKSAACDKVFSVTSIPRTFYKISHHLHEVECC